MRGLHTKDAARGRATRSPGPSRFLSALVTAGLVAGVLIAIAMLGPALLGLQRYVITGDSMTGTYDRGSLVYSELVPVNRLEVGDVITYDPPGASGGGGLVTHRIISIDSDRRGPAALRTKGDANATRDPWQFTLRDSEQARVVASIPYLGYAFAALAVPEVRMAAIGIPAALLALGLLVGLWRDAGDEARANGLDQRPAKAQG